MGLAGRPKIRLDAKVDLHRTGGEPRTAAGSEHRRLWLLGQAEHTAIKRSGRVLVPCGHGELDVVDAGQRSHATTLPPLCRLAWPR
jgi:hypothetical protein